MSDTVSKEPPIALVNAEWTNDFGIHRDMLVSANDDLVRTYETNQVMVTHASELIALIKS